MTDIEQIKAAQMWAWIGEDDATPPREPGIVGVKQGQTPSGIIPLASIRQGKLTQDYIVQQMKLLATFTGKRRHLVRFRFEAIEETIEAEV